MKRIILTLILLVLAATGIHASTRPGPAPETGYFYAITTRYHDLYYDRDTYCINEYTGHKWVQHSFGINGFKYDEDCLK